MSRAGLFNAAGLFATLVVAMTQVARSEQRATEPMRQELLLEGDLVAVDRDGKRALVDRMGHAVPLVRYERIVSGSTVADQLLIELCEPDRIAAFTAYGKEQHGHPAYTAKPAHHGLNNLELILSLKPDLVLTHHLGDPRQLSRLRERGVAVFDLGEMRGLSTLRRNIVEVAALLGKSEEGRRYRQSLETRLTHVALHVPRLERREALYVSTYGTQIFGGSVGSSYHDVLSFAGLVDVAPGNGQEYPKYSPEQLLELDPELVVTGERMGDALCAQAGLSRLRACRERDRIREVPRSLMGDPGPRMLEAAEVLHGLVYGEQATGGEPDATEERP